MDARTTDTFRRLRGAGLRVTPQRRAVLDAVERLDHASADGVLAAVRDAMPELGRATVYKALGDLEDAGLVRRVADIADAARYEPARDAPHPHFRCVGCGRVVDLPGERLSLRPPGDGYVVERVRAVAEGRCPACAAAGRAPGGP